MAERIIRHGVFQYFAPTKQIVGGEEKEVLVEVMAFHNQKVDVPRDIDLERGDRLGAFWSYDDAVNHYAALDQAAPGLVPQGLEDLPEPAPSGGSDGDPEAVELGALDHAELVEWLMGVGMFDGQKKPTAAEVVAAVDGDPELAKRVLEAEHEATGAAPRVEVAKNLGAVVDSGGTQAPA